MNRSGFLVGFETATKSRLRYPRIARNSRNKPPDSAIVTGSVSTQAKAMLRTIWGFRFLMPRFATMEPAIADDNTRVVEEGKW